MPYIEVSNYTIFILPIELSFKSIEQDLDYSKIAVIVDENTKLHCLPLIEPLLPKGQYEIIEIISGEAQKNIQTCTQIWNKLLELNFDRNALVINLGGGVIGDMGGFCAGTYKRGIDFLQIPTTLLSQVDASVGGKLGIDFGDIKNSIGLFQDPQAVLIDSAFINTLPYEELRSGFAEIIKHALIASEIMWLLLQTTTDLKGIEDWSGIVESSVEIKKDIVEKDPYEQGLRKALNFGHTIGHAIESWSIQKDRRLLHGEAIAIGMICEAYLSQQVGLSKEDLETITAYILEIYGKIDLPATAYPDFIKLMKNDKKNEAGNINFTMIPAPGEVLINQTCSEADIIKSLDYYAAASLAST